MDRAGVGELVTLLERADVLFACQDGPVDRSTICAEADCSRSTAYRVTGDLEERGYLERLSGGYRVTDVGAAAAAQIRHFQSGFSGAQHMAPVLQYVDATGLVDAMHVFADAEVHEASPSTPYLLEDRLLSIIGETERRLLGGTGSSSSAVVFDRTRNAIGPDVDVDHVLTPTALADVRARYHAGEATPSAFDESAVHVVEAVPLDLVVYDDTLVVPGPDEATGALGAMAITENPKAVSWACAHIARLRDTGEPWPA